MIDSIPHAAVLAMFVTFIAYLHRPRLKVFVFSLPVPFTCAYLATRQPVDATHLIGLSMTVMYHWCVYLLVRRRNAPLWLAIPAALASYLITASAMRPMQHASMPLVIAMLLFAWLLGVSLYRPAREPGHRSFSPVWIKLPSIFLIALVVMTMTDLMAGAVTTFPFAGMFTSYEMRHSLRTLAGQYTINVIGIGLLIVTIWLLQNTLPAPWPLLIGWGIVAVTVGVLYVTGLGRPLPAPLELNTEDYSLPESR